MTKEDRKESEAKGFTVTDRRGEAKDEEPRKSEPELPPKRPKGPATPRKLDFTSFVISMSTSAFVHMGFLEDPVTHHQEKNLELARQDIDIIELLAEKTKGILLSGNRGQLAASI